MHLATRVVLAAFLVAAPTAAHSQTAKEPSSARRLDVKTAIDEVLALKTDPDRVAQVSGLTLKRDVGEIHLDNGLLYLSKPIYGKTVAAVFIGKGTLRYSPPTDVERKQLARFYKKEAIAEPFESALLFFTDSTMTELSRSLKFTHIGNADETGEIIESFIESIADERKQDVEPSFVRALVNGGDLFFAMFEGSESGRFFYEIDPFAWEKVGFMRRATARLHDVGRDEITRHHLQQEYRRGIDRSADIAELSFDHYSIRTTIALDLSFAAAYDVGMKMLRDSIRWTFFYLTPDLAIDSMRWRSGERVEYHRRDRSYVVWIRNTTQMQGGAIGGIRIWAHGAPLGRVNNTVYLKTSSLWYPRHEFKQRAPFDLEYTTPGEFMFASAGRPIDEPTKNEDGTVTSRWKLDDPSRNVSFNIGYFYEIKSTPDSLPPIVVLRDREMTKGVAEQVSWDVEHCLLFFQHLFGPTRAKHFSATQIPFNHGEAFPGLIHLSWLTFEGDQAGRASNSVEVRRDGYHEFFRAHEVAHQWWGIGVDYQSYHDQWLSEGFATYSGLMYMRAALKDNAMFLDWLRFYRDEIVENRKSMFGDGQEAGPIWLGRRTNSSTTSGDYSLIIYKKGAWVLHMLRMLLLDPATLSDAKFQAMMREFHTGFVGRLATTADFQRVVEKHVGAKMDWFFQQWVYGTSVPTITFSHNVKKTPEGKYMLKCRVEQKDVDATFLTQPMLTIDFGDKGVSRMRRPVQGPRGDFELLLPMEPKRVTFNDFESVLCVYEEVDWED